jgi:hypothetical protein
MLSINELCKIYIVNNSSNHNDVNKVPMSVLKHENQPKLINIKILQLFKFVKVNYKLFLLLVSIVQMNCSDNFHGSLKAKNMWSCRFQNNVRSKCF